MSPYRFVPTLVLAASLAFACAGGIVRAATPAGVKIENFTFEPATLSVPAGTTVTFTNADDIPHSVVASGGGFRSKALDTGDTFTFTFKTPGDYGYFCGLHPHMQGHVVVTP